MLNMKTVRAALLLFSCTLFACASPQQNNQRSTAASSSDSLTQVINAPIQFITGFYLGYITYQTNPKYTQNDVKKLLKNSCTSELLQKIEKEQPDNDPFLNAQDVDKNWLRNLAVKKISENEFVVSYKLTNEERRVEIPVQVKQTTSGFRIASVGEY
jgi:hypothetical protein